MLYLANSKSFYADKFLDKDTGIPLTYSKFPHILKGVCRLRSYLGYPPVRDALPNTTHYALAALQHTSIFSKLITQNVDGLHHKALAPLWSPRRTQERILELHGTLHV